MAKESDYIVLQDAKAKGLTDLVRERQGKDWVCTGGVAIVMAMPAQVSGSYIADGPQFIYAQAMIKPME